MSNHQETLEEELLWTLRTDIASGLVRVIGESQRYADLIYKNFSFVGTKINWREVPGHVVTQIDWQKGQNYAEDSLERLEYLDTVYSFFDNVLKVTQTPITANLVVMGDGAMDVALELTSGVLRKYLLDVIELPQHTYIIPPDIRWCLNYTMEGYIDFGFRPEL